MRRVKNSEEKAHMHYHQITVLILMVVFAAACGTAPTSTSSPTAVPPTPVKAVASPTTLPPTVTLTIELPTSTALPATATNQPPTPVPATEEVETDTNQDNANMREENLMNIQVGDHVLTATLAENSSADALKTALAAGPITINMRDYERMEKVGSLGMNLPRNDEQITAEAGDLILYQGNAFVIYYAPNSWNFTRLGKIKDVTAPELQQILGDGDVTITLSLASGG